MILDAYLMAAPAAAATAADAPNMDDPLQDDPVGPSLVPPAEVLCSDPPTVFCADPVVLPDGPAAAAGRCDADCCCWVVERAAG
jgi:hypothetical protein